MRFHNEIVSDLSSGGRRYSFIIDRLGDGDDALEPADDWCRGYLLGTAMREDEWKGAMELPELQEAFLPILALAHSEKPGLDPIENAHAYQAMVDLHPECAVEISEWWRKQSATTMQGSSGPSHFGTVRRAEPKISPNAPCPCGSGKKY